MTGFELRISGVGSDRFTNFATPKANARKRVLLGRLLIAMLTSVIRLDDFWTLGNLLKPLATINLPKSPTFLGNFCKGVKIHHISSEIIFGQLL